MEKFRECLRRLDEIASSKMKYGDLDDRVCMVYCPSSYESALEGMELELSKVHEELDSNLQEKKKIATSSKISTSNLARSAADAAVQKALSRDVQMDDGQAVPSDAWLDHASMGLGVGKALEVTVEQRLMPMILAENRSKGEMDYHRILDTLLLNADESLNTGEGLDRLERLEGAPAGGGVGRGDDESVYSVTSQISVTSSTRMTAGQRRRWQKQQKKTKTSQPQMQPMLSPHPEATSNTVSAVAGRQQSFMGSPSYLCEVFHDSYGIGSQPAKGLIECSGYSAKRTSEGGTHFYPPSSHIPDLLVFNTTRKSYGIAEAASMAGTQIAGKTSSLKSAEDTGDGNADVRPVSPTSAARKTQLAGSANKSSLAHLVFKADANNSGSKASPTLDLPASLPHALK